MKRTPTPKGTLLLLICGLFTMNALCQTPMPPRIQKQAYLEMGNQTAITIRWRTDIPSDSKVELGTVKGIYTMTVTDSKDTTEHMVRVTGLTPDTKYYYRISSGGMKFGVNDYNFFRTAPPANTTRKIRIVAFGDCGQGEFSYMSDNKQNYYKFLQDNGIDAPDALLLLGDNAYDEGSEDQYRRKFFNNYRDTILRSHKLYPTIGNHDYANDESLKTSRDLAYYTNFSTPQNGECGGVPSHKPNYYSFDIGSIHFLSMDSWGIENDGTDMGTAGNSAIKTWAIQDLEANKSKWTIAFWHHPPYSRGSHNSDLETDMIDIRQNFIDVMESHGVDMIITGHSHSYERGYLMKDFRGNWNTFDPAVNAVSTSSGAYTDASSCPYVYNSTPLKHGTVYVVAGSTGAAGDVRVNFGSYGFPFSVNDAGIFYFEVEGNRLDAKMLRRDGTVFDRFTIMKDVNNTVEKNILPGSSVTLTASWPGDYKWSNGASTKAITLTPPNGTTEYTCTDAYGCVTDRFTVNSLIVTPVNLTDYKAYLNADQVHVDWTTASESNSWYFSVDRSVDGSHFVSLARVNAAGNSSTPHNYSYIDSRPLAGASYYRLSQVDLNGATKLYDIKKISNAGGRTFDINLSARGEVLNISLQTNSSDKVNLAVYDLSGRTILTRSWTINAGLSQFQENLRKGVYILKFTNKVNETLTQRILIE